MCLRWSLASPVIVLNRKINDKQKLYTTKRYKPQYCAMACSAEPAPQSHRNRYNAFILNYQTVLDSG